MLLLLANSGFFEDEWSVTGAFAGPDYRSRISDYINVKSGEAALHYVLHLPK
jgi:hypothetical protein